MDEPNVGSWWRCRHARQYRFRYDGRTYDGAYRFTRFRDDEDEGAAEIEIYSLNDMEPSTEK